ncbi:Rv1535 domain-containing protein [Mycobacterium sp. HUMS_1102779]|uniref:Rv1535 domain-containing protein n=1 Tax=Mycobacterium sp. HUMS_1102779 TaxID=3383487 RepID=UPI003899E702
MTTSETLADPLISPVASALAVPLRHVYALLWRVGIVEIVATGRPRRQSADLCPDCPISPRHRSPRPGRPSRPRRFPEPAPSRADPAECSRAAG